MPPFHVLVAYNGPRRLQGIAASHSRVQLPISKNLSTRFRLVNDWLTTTYRLVVSRATVIAGETTICSATSGARSAPAADVTPGRVAAFGRSLSLGGPGIDNLCEHLVVNPLGTDRTERAENGAGIIRSRKRVIPQRSVDPLHASMRPRSIDRGNTPITSIDGGVMLLLQWGRDQSHVLSGKSIVRSNSAHVTPVFVQT